MRTCVLAIVLIESIVGSGCPAPASQTATTTTTHVTVTPPVNAKPVVTSKGLEPPQPALRLPTNFVPSRYEAALHIDPAKPTFDGVISIVGEVSELSSVIWLHGRGLTVQRAVATRGDPFGTPGGTSSALTITPRADELLEVRAEPALAAGSWTLTIEYTGTIDDNNTTGAFKETVAASTYVFSQFEAVYARRVFPCVDEPGSKVPWKLTLDVPSGVTAVSNTPIETATSLGDGGKRFAFAVTKPLPSYLVAFAIGPFDIVDAGTTKTGVPVRIFTLKGRAPDAAWAAKSTPRILELLEDWFGAPYPYEKLDLITVPLTIGFGAMENPGAVTFSEDSMLFDQQHPAPTRRHTWVMYASHELAHQWFGDYVTMAWWDDIWLNEGFANWMQSKIAARFDPTWHDELSELDLRNSALVADSVVSARQIRQPIQTPDDIFNVFDGITYDKGASVLNMFESYLGREAFQKGVRAYLTARAHGNATSSDFLGAMNASSGKDLTREFSSFLDQGGAPELTATIACDGAPRLKLTQRRFVPPGAPAPATAQTWVVPVCVAFDRDGKRAEACTVLDTATAELPLPAGKKCPRWVMANVGGRGYYHTSPTATEVTALRDEGWDQLTWTERRALFTDVDWAVMAGRLPLALGLSFVPKLLAGGDRFTIGDAIGFAASFDAGMPDDLRPKYEAWLRATLGAGAAKAGLVPRDGDDLDTESTRAQLVGVVVGVARDPALTAEAVRLAPTWRGLPQAVRGTVLAIAVDANAELFERTLREVPTEKVQDDREEMLGALAGVRDPARHVAALGLLLDGKVDIRESMWMLFGGRDRAAQDVSRAFFREHQAAILARIPHEDTTGSATALAGVFTSVCDPARRAETVQTIHAMFDSFPGSARPLAQTIEGMDQCIARRALVAAEVRAWVSGMKLPKPGTAPAAAAKTPPGPILEKPPAKAPAKVPAKKKATKK